MDRERFEKLFPWELSTGKRMPFTAAGAAENVAAELVKRWAWGHIHFDMPRIPCTPRERAEVLDGVAEALRAMARSEREK